MRDEQSVICLFPKCCYLQKLYTVCDVAMNIIMSKSTTYSLESPKDPVLPARYFTQPDKVHLGVLIFLEISLFESFLLVIQVFFPNSS